MNRLVIVGNGFDLAHGLKTRYSNFMDWYWGTVFSGSKEQLHTLNHADDLINFNVQFSGTYSHEYLIRFTRIRKYKDYKHFLGIIYDVSYNGFHQELLFLNHFFKVICTKYNDVDWVDIENEYYALLKICLNDKYPGGAEKLNEQFEVVKALFKQYLEKQIEYLKIDNSNNYETNEIKDKILEIFRYKYDSSFPVDIEETTVVDHDTLREFPKEFHRAIYNFNNDLNLNKCRVDLEPVTLLLNFNYTSLTRFYRNAMSDKKLFGKVYENQIHGSLENPQIPNDDKKRNYNLIFGFGDEMDDDYKAIEKKNNNEYLRNIKSFGYFQTSNYRNLLDSLEAGVFQVWIMGHSCGLSDRILLNKVFEHHNCCSIKVFYHENLEKGIDNYNDIVQNISRHFNKKEVMRERVVPKNLCMPLPQKES